MRRTGRRGVAETRQPGPVPLERVIRTQEATAAQDTDTAQTCPRYAGTGRHNGRMSVSPGLVPRSGVGAGRATGAPPHTFDFDHHPSMLDRVLLRPPEPKPAARWWAGSAASQHTARRVHDRPSQPPTEIEPGPETALVIGLTPSGERANPRRSPPRSWLVLRRPVRGHDCGKLPIHPRPVDPPPDRNIANTGIAHAAGGVAGVCPKPARRAAHDTAHHWAVDRPAGQRDHRHHLRTKMRRPRQRTV